MSILTVKNLKKKFRKIQAVNDLSFEIQPGELIGLIGPNGAGKSTTMNCICGRILPESGEILVNGVNIWQDPIAGRKSIGFVPQILDLPEFLTAEEYLHFVADIREVPKDERQEIETLLTLTELQDDRHRIIKEFSGGMLRKLAICGALIGSPKLLILDESFVGLDPESTFKIRQRLTQFCEAGGSIILSSHILDMLEHVCSRVVMIVDGELLFDETMEDTLNRIPNAGLTSIYLAGVGKG